MHAQLALPAALLLAWFCCSAGATPPTAAHVKGQGDWCAAPESHRHEAVHKVEQERDHLEYELSDAQLMLRSEIIRSSSELDLGEAAGMSVGRRAGRRLVRRMKPRRGGGGFRVGPPFSMKVGFQGNHEELEVQALIDEGSGGTAADRREPSDHKADYWMMGHARMFPLNYGHALVPPAQRDFTLMESSSYKIWCSKKKALQVAAGGTPATEVESHKGGTVFLGYPGEEAGKLDAQPRKGTVLQVTKTGVIKLITAPPKPKKDANFGASVAVDGSTAIFGAPDEKVGLLNKAGAVYIKDLASGNITRIISTSPAGGARFGASVSLADGTLLISAPGERVRGHQQAGAVYLRLRGSTGLTSLTSTRPHQNARFGHKYFLFGETKKVRSFYAEYTLIIAQDTEKIDGMYGAGAVYIKRGVKQTLKRIVSLTPCKRGSFGKTIAFSGDTVAIGAPGEHSRGKTNAGAVYLDHGKGTLTRLESTRPRHKARFGEKIVLKDGLLVIGAPSEVTGAGKRGAVYLYDIAKKKMVRLVSSRRQGKQKGAYFGMQIFLTLAKGQPVLVISSPYEGKREGAVYIKRGHWGSSKDLIRRTSPRPVQNGRFGLSIDLKADNLAIGERGATAHGKARAGSVHLIKLSWMDGLSRSSAVLKTAAMKTVTSPKPVQGGFFGRKVQFHGHAILIVLGALDQPATLVQQGQDNHHGKLRATSKVMSLKTKANGKVRSVHVAWPTIVVQEDRAVTTFLVKKPFPKEKAAQDVYDSSFHRDGLLENGSLRCSQFVNTNNPVAKKLMYWFKEWTTDTKGTEEITSPVPICKGGISKRGICKGTSLTFKFMKKQLEVRSGNKQGLLQKHLVCLDVDGGRQCCMSKELVVNKIEWTKVFESSLKLW